MVLALQTPVGPNFLKDWPSQNAVNCNLIDGYAGACLPSQALQAYTPILTANGTNPTLGTTGALIQGYYFRMFDLVFTWGQFIFGTGMNKGSGEYAISLPFPVRTNLVQGGSLANCTPIIGNAQAYDQSDGTARQPLTVAVKTTTTVVFQLRLGTAGVTRSLTDVAPYTPVAGDGVMWSARYQREPQ
jgi:hypothetical protein